jgi:peptide/nickel transport system permease protein
LIEEAKAGSKFRWLARRPLLRVKLLLGLVLLLVFYGVTLFADFIAPYDYRFQSKLEPAAPPSPIRFRDEEGNVHLRPFIYERQLQDPLARTYREDRSKPYPLALFVRGSSYRLCGILPTNLHLFGVQGAGTEAPRIYLLGTDALGRDRFTRLVIASRFSLLIAPLSTLLAGALGIVLGCLAGYGGRVTDAFLMRAVDLMMALPTLVVILAARAAFPPELPPVRAGFLLISIFVAVGWAEIARVARGQVMALRQQDFILAAQSIGLSQLRILARHILPNMSRALIVQMTLMVPTFLLTETALSYLGVGLQDPEPSWGYMLMAASDLSLLQAQPLVVLAPAFAIFFFVLGVRLVSAGLQSREWI